MLLTNSREWMLTETGYDHALRLLNIPIAQKELLPIKSYEVQKAVNKIRSQERPENYNPLDTKRKTLRVTQEAIFRSRSFRQAIIEAYNFSCAVCGLKIRSPNALQWEVEAAHIVPRSFNGKDDILNGLALCRLHHWVFDVGWFTLDDDFRVLASRRIQNLAADFGKIWNYDFTRPLAIERLAITLPKEKTIHPHPNAVRWHRAKIFVI